jgi:hypothetical protein
MDSSDDVIREDEASDRAMIGLDRVKIKSRVGPSKDRQMVIKPTNIWYCARIRSFAVPKPSHSYPDFTILDVLALRLRCLVLDDQR